MESREDYELVSQTARAEGRAHVGVVVLGRAEETDHVERWLEAGKYVDGVCGFAIGQTRLFGNTKLTSKTRQNIVILVPSPLCRCDLFECYRKNVDSCTKSKKFFHVIQNVVFVAALTPQLLTERNTNTTNTHIHTATCVFACVEWPATTS
jgi:hypothetical protein